LKRFLVVLLTVIMAFSLAGNVSAANVSQPKPQPLSIAVSLDGQALDLASSLVVVKGKTYVEYGQLLKAFGYEAQFDAVTQSILALADGQQIQMSVGGDVVFVNGLTMPSTGEVIILNGKTLVGLRFWGVITGHKVTWDFKTHSITLAYLGPTPEEKAAVYDVFDKMLLIEASGDPNGMNSLLSSDTILDVKALQESWANVRTKTVVDAKFLQSYSNQEAVVISFEDTTKVSGAFYPDNKAQNRYTLHRDADGSWKIFNVEPLQVELTNVPGMFEQGVTIPDADRTAIMEVFGAQIKATNEKNIDAYLATIEESPIKAEVKTNLEQIFPTVTINGALEKSAIVAYNGTDTATLLVSLISEIETNGQKTKVRAVVINDAHKVDGKWLLSAEANNLVNEQLE
jgi:hypothetical protein